MNKLLRHPLPTSLALATGLRLALLTLPGPGRDEAAYAYWAWHPQAFYAPLLQFLVRLADVLPLSGLLRLRLPSLLGGILVLVLADLRLRRAGSGLSVRWLSLLALATCEWQTYTGAILHPDTLLLGALLMAALAAQRGHLLAFAVSISLSALAKPTGILFLPVAMVLAGILFPGSPWRRMAVARLILLATLVQLGWRVNPAMLEAMTEFARLDPALPWKLRLSAGAASVLVMGGPLLLFLAAGGLWQRLQLLLREKAILLRRRSGAGSGAAAPPPAVVMEDPRLREAMASLSLATVLLGAFLLAALAHGQIKANWVLPAAVLLMPLKAVAFVDIRRRGLPRAVAALSLAAAVITSTTTVLAHRNPSSFSFLETTAQRWKLGYSLLAGQREKRVSPTRSWQQRFGEYQDLEPFAARVRETWHELEGPGEIGWIVSDDYGLAAQLAWYEHRSGEKSGHSRGPTLVIPGDGLYLKELDRHGLIPDGPFLLLAVQCPVDSLDKNLRRETPAEFLRHPLTGGRVELAGGRAERAGGSPLLPPRSPAALGRALR